ncbi:MAG: DUF1569 domain-containing protein [Bacteroidetes bacterium]|nr:DUF1569 domain-containing protein [Bacteroidota bacterium]
MKNILEAAHRNEVIARIEKLSSNDSPLWGKMNVNEMICHISDQIKISHGEIKTEYVGNKFLETVMIKLILLGLPAPKGKVETVKELKQGVGGTPPKNFDNDKNLLISKIKEFDSTFPADKKLRHPAFGYMNKKQWGRLIFTHLNHHLKQFNR